MGTLYLVRHAHAGSRSAWDGPDVIRPLSERGVREAEGIRDLLGGEGISRLISSPATRCLQTLAPLGDALGLAVESEERLGEGAWLDDVLGLLRDVASKDVVLCSHGDVIPAVLESQVRAGMHTTHELRWPKASTWVLSWNGTGATTAAYLPPPR